MAVKTENGAVRELLNSQRVLALALLIDGAPSVSLLPFALDDSFTACYVHASELAKHSRGLKTGASFSALVHAADLPDKDPLQIARLTVDGTVTALDRGTAEYEVAKQAYLARFPESAVTFELEDFRLYKLEFRSGRFVQGFARAWNVGIDDFKALSE